MDDYLKWLNSQLSADMNLQRKQKSGPYSKFIQIRIKVLISCKKGYERFLNGQLSSQPVSKEDGLKRD